VTFLGARTFESLRIRDYRFLWLGQLTTSMGQWMDQVTRTWLIYLMTGSAFQLGLISAARGVPLLLFGTIAGAVADRYGRKSQLVIAQCTNAVLNATLATLVLTGNVQPWHVYATGFLAGTVQAFQQPARQVLINDVVGRKNLLNAISLNSAALNVSRGLGPGISGLVIAFLGVPVSYFIQAGLYAFATVWTFQIRVPANAVHSVKSKANESIFGSTLEGLRYVGANKIILGLMVLGLAPMVLGMPFISLMPLFAIHVFNGDSTTQGWLSMMVGVGAVAGTLTMASLDRAQTSGKLLIIGAIVFGLSLVLFSLSPVLALAMSFTLIAGFANGGYTSQNQTMIQLLSPSEMRGRIMGLYLLNRGLMPIGSILAGTLATFFGGPLAVTFMGASCLCLAIGVALFAPAIWNLRVSGDT
jgi:MFS family permease